MKRFMLLNLLFFPGSQKTQGTEEPSLGSNSQPNGYRTPQTTKRPSVVMGPPLTPAYRLPRKTTGLSRGLNEHTVSNEQGQGAHQSTPGEHQLPEGADALQLM